MGLRRAALELSPGILQVPFHGRRDAAEKDGIPFGSFEWFQHNCFQNSQKNWFFLPNFYCQKTPLVVMMHRREHSRRPKRCLKREKLGCFRRKTLLLPSSPKAKGYNTPVLPVSHAPPYSCLEILTRPSSWAFSLVMRCHRKRRESFWSPGVVLAEFF